MAKQYASLRNVKFLLNEVFNVSELTKFDHFKEYDKESLDMLVDTAKQISDTVLFPFYTDMDRKPAEFENGRIRVHEQVANVIKTMGENGWIGAISDVEHGGQQIPYMIDAAANFLFGAANNSPIMFTGLTAGSAELIVAFGSKELQEKYVPKMYAGQWQGTMCLTEPQAGSSLSDITSSATPQEDGSYKIKGQKIFISAGDHNYTENIVHLVLAKIDGAPLGTKGISLFVVPRMRSTADGGLEFNDVNTAGTFHKMGQKATPAAHLSFGDKDDCYGYLVGAPHQGLSYMFKMMNGARLGVGLTAISIASAAYYASLEYASERPQGRKISEHDVEEAPQTLIINHPDVKRMLLFQKSIVEGCLSLLMEGARYADMLKVTPEGKEKDRYAMLLDVLTPVIKTYSSEAGIESVSQGLQCFGGYGFCEDFPLEQMYRDIRICSIYEGTTGIQSLDLLVRKVVGTGGKTLMVLAEEMNKTIQEANTFDDLKKYTQKLQNGMKTLQDVTQHLAGLAMKGDKEAFVADATLYMELFSIITISWQWLKQATVAKQTLVAGKAQGDDVHFYESKILTMKFYFAYELPKIQGLATRLTDDELLTVSVEKELFA